MRLNHILVLACLAVAGVCHGGLADPAAVYKQAMEDKVVASPDSGEDFCWYARVYVDRYRRGYERTKDTVWLDWSVKYFDFIVSRMKTGPDGYKGWIGTYEYDRRPGRLARGRRADGRHARVRRNRAQGPRAEGQVRRGRPRYVQIAKRDVFEKWDTRGTWHDDGAFGAYNAWNHFGGANNQWTWTTRSTTRADAALQQAERHGPAALRLYRITGEERFRTSAMKVFGS